MSTDNEKAPYIKHDPVNHPRHYNLTHSGGMECIDLVEKMSFCGGNAVKYIWRAGLKGDRVEDLRKARWYVERQRDNDEAESDEFRNECDLHRAAALGFPALEAAAIMHIIHEEFDLALVVIDTLIAGAGGQT